MKLSELAALPLTYAEVGATAATLPSGYHHVQKSAVIGRGRARFEQAAATGMRWGMLRGAGVRVEATTEVAQVGSEVIVHLGPVRAPCRVVYVVDEPDRRGFAYGTLPGHAESGEELFLVRYDPDTDEVSAAVTAFSRHATWWSRLASPVTSLVQRIVTERYLQAL
ncbi:DUF1990 family protein [Mycolicibacterium holsaticum]|uniref:DUF1990 domain-containing protein n=1 Tax=Mycolicibacterium holsaticum TaxID=152142 RepID=A0A1E3RSE8_9MYCO|nr:DUF1990 domain-containing protein [Mycolicibacterium holsaticum]MDA4109708.1 hypothetical protein [Mycolicibacterium holsaticum DSM 44478 = JCM 12374]ODQ92764.1 hypothetical protein BHQ17_15945 [Mycolicibacterium holsaticum]QZA10636.1 DUF1990 domain-containing protein [Mycolicibacterium holsaticum DSM 44478 = JCM 12374]UNC11859.1 DUF1990 domain-containing protein [Mycolicibacterium holsaticum DSM 44478 = JCM 12374]